MGKSCSLSESCLLTASQEREGRRREVAREGVTVTTSYTVMQWNTHKEIHALLYTHGMVTGMVSMRTCIPYITF